ncbi:MAG: glycosyl transferase GT17 family protein [Lachnospiraceae bacterium]|nr:glycosyl transferase GT17 family protein [Lachnospiraceae bacterium]
MVYDCFQFFNELDILKIRLHVLSDVVDRFVISEATETFSGRKKPMYYLEHQDEFAEFADRIIHVTVEDTPAGGTHERDNFQKNAVGRGLAGCTDEDIVIFSDLDEIPNPDKIKEILADFDPTKVYHFAQRLFYCYLNMEETSGSLLSISGEFDGVKDRKWIGSKMVSYRLLRERGWQLGELREPERKADGIRVADGGWHFGYMGGAGEKDVRRRVQDKVVSAAHQEYNSRWTLSQVADHIRDGEDIFGRDARFVRREIDEGYPAWLREHWQEYPHLILQKESESGRRLRHLRMWAAKALHEAEVCMKRTVKKLIGKDR